MQCISSGNLMESKPFEMNESKPHPRSPRCSSFPLSHSLKQWLHLSPASGQTALGLELHWHQTELGVAFVCEVSAPKIKWEKQMQPGVKSREADSGWVPVNIHCNGESSEAKARPFARRCRRARSLGAPALPFGQGHVPSGPRHPVSISLSHHPGSGRAPLCWHRAFEGSRPNKRDRGALPAQKHCPTTQLEARIWGTTRNLRLGVRSYNFLLKNFHECVRFLRTLGWRSGAISPGRGRTVTILGDNPQEGVSWDLMKEGSQLQGHPGSAGLLEL